MRKLEKTRREKRSREVEYTQLDLKRGRTRRMMKKREKKGFCQLMSVPGVMLKYILNDTKRKSNEKSKKVSINR